MKSLTKFFIAFLAITGAVALSTGLVGIDFGRQNFWQNHGVFFLIFITIFPRLTLLLSSVPFGGLFWWVGWIFAPRLLVAMLATLTYWTQNPVLVVITWLIAFGGESSEKYVVIQRAGQSSFRGPRNAKWVEAEVVETRKPGSLPPFN